MNSVTKTLFAICGIIFLTNCGVDGRIIDHTQRIIYSYTGQLTTISAGSSYQKTAAGYRISSSIGSPLGGKNRFVTRNGYIIYLSSSGNTASSNSVTTIR